MKLREFNDCLRILKTAHAMPISQLQGMFAVSMYAAIWNTLHLIAYQEGYHLDVQIEAFYQFYADVNERRQ